MCPFCADFSQSYNYDICMYVCVYVYANVCILYYIISYCIILYYIILYYKISYCIILYCIVLYYIILYSTLPCTRAQKACILPIVPKLATKSSMTPRPCSSLPPKNDEAPEWFHDPWPVPGHWHTYAGADVNILNLQLQPCHHIQMEYTYLYI